MADMRSGPTRKETQLSEAQSYANIAAEHSYWDLLPPSLQSAVFTEDRALDSYHNVLFSLTLFYTRIHQWPKHITLVSHGFKKPRLVDCNCAAVGWPLDRVSFLGIDPPGMEAVLASGKGDAALGVGRAVDDWLADPHGRGEVLAGKRRKRNPWETWQGVFERGEKNRGGLLTLGEGEQEMLIGDAKRPWL